MNLVKLIAEKNLVEAEKLFKEQMDTLARKKLLEVKKMIGAKVSDDHESYKKALKAALIKHRKNEKKFPTTTITKSVREDFNSVFGQGYSGDDSILRNAMKRTDINNRSKIASRPSRSTTASARPTAPRAPVRPSVRPSTAAVRSTPRPDANDPGGSYPNPDAPTPQLPQAPATPTVTPTPPPATPYSWNTRRSTMPIDVSKNAAPRAPAAVPATPAVAPTSTVPATPQPSATTGGFLNSLSNIFTGTGGSTRLGTAKSVNESIKGWKNAHSDLAKFREKSGQASKYKVHKLKKDGQLSGMHDASNYFSTEEEAHKYIQRVKDLNPGYKDKTTHAIFDPDGKEIGRK